jgi:hypothetical protein
LLGVDYFCFQHNPAEAEVVRRYFVCFFVTKPQTYIVTGSQPVGLFCLGIHFAIFKTRLTKIWNEMPQQLVRAALVYPKKSKKYIFLGESAK